ncbi:TetR family transcriptional regulator [Cronobacter sakazakii]|uniref:TetR/AcrR family transcriptional regulator n=1 Tax=Cronobacter sakazakii TaxID=28141 RepID=UPI000CFB2383|nr:TetR/AcrR family transcriptional regulator [Cronobacter sakazakii]EKK3981571.1 TetR family transcriptional regulator [Cronobacter sakazakii]EKM6344865.1 TetR family transcriptional regulator [Cronobacter sakazakii]EKM6353760.1 TetR family transcriptional regulator [Cronobacter sakazakii]EKM6369072.1 TetR family transcriptional regulator [Cronobacter sakazakii]EKM6377522.1 TetR family transcriptional regulator [Cronobacter sakazakii]
MSKAHHRSKSPEALRQTLLECAAGVIAEQGLTGLTQEKVIRRAGISKGGLQHHFPTRQALVDGVMHHLEQALLEEIQTLMAQDPNPNGRATRAYIHACVRKMPDSEQAMHRALMTAIFADPALQQRWGVFLRDALPRDDDEHASPDVARRRLLCRMTADGFWFAALCGDHTVPPDDRAALIETLLAMTE